MDVISRVEAYTGELTPPRIFVACAAAIYFFAFGPRIPRIFGFAKTEYHHAQNSLQIRLKDGTKTPFSQFCKSVIPPCRVNPFLFNGHLQTIWTAVANTSRDVYYKRWVFEQEDPVFRGSFAVDFVTKPYNDKTDKELPPRTTHYTKDEFENIGSDDTKPMLVTLHGLSGGSHELYLRELLAKLVDDEGGWEACVVISRGCALSKITSSVLYNARATWDTRQVVKWLRQKFPNRPLFGCGFSLGANIMTNYIGEEGDKCELKAAVVFSSPWDLAIGNKALRKTWIGLNIYSTSMGSSLKKLFERHVDVLSKNPGFDVPAIRRLKYLHEFDELVQTVSWGYPSASAYYRDASSSDTLFNVRIPFLSINALDDPIAAADSLPFDEMKRTPYGVLCATELGGHLSWFQLGGTRWYVSAGAEYLKKLARDVDLEALPKAGDATANGHGEDLIVKSSEAGHKLLFTPTRRKWHTDV